MLVIKPTGIKDRPITTVEHFARQFVIHEDGCWQWIGFVAKSGYGQFTINKTSKFAHRVMWELVGNEVDLTKQLDHLCRNRACINPEHLEQVTAKENTHRSTSVSAENHVKTHCKYGHALSGDNLRIKLREIHGGSPERVCRECARRNVRNHRLRRDQLVIEQQEQIKRLKEALGEV